MFSFACCMLALISVGQVRSARSVFEQGSGGVKSAIDLVNKSWVGNCN